MIKNGVYYGVPAETYHAWPFASKSRLLQFRRSPAHSLIDTPVSPAKKLGTYAHAAVLEPDLFAAKALRCPKIDRRTKDWKEIEAANPDRWLIQDPEWLAIERIRDRLWSHPVAGPLLRGKGHNEASIVFADPDTGVRCKARADRMTASSIVDLKTTTNAHWASFALDAVTYGYYLQSAMYRRGVLSQYARKMPFIAVAVETDPPHEVAVYTLDGQHAEIELSTHLRAWKQCEESGKWPGYDERLLDLPEPRKAAWVYTPDRSEDWSG